MDWAILTGGDVNGQPLVLRSISCGMQRIDAGSTATGLSHNENRVKLVKLRSSSEIIEMRFESILIEFKFSRDQIKAGITKIKLNATSIDMIFRNDSMQGGKSSKYELFATKE